MKYLIKEWEIPSEEDAEIDEYQLKIYEGNSKAWDLLIISLIDISFELVRMNPGRHS